jgi:Uma2 family endonuclease
MGRAPQNLPMTAEEFLAWDASQTVRHEFVRGEVLAMAGAGEAHVTGTGEAHVTVAGNVYLALRQHLAGSPCRTFITDMKLHVAAADAYFYPDVLVTCSALDARDPLVKREPVLPAEVLSPATAAYDRGEKFAAYRQIDSLREYLLIDPQTRRADLYRKGDDGLWVLHPAAPGEGVQLASVDLDLTAERLWAEVPAD